MKTTQTKPTPQQALPLPNLILPEFTGREDLDRFLDQMSTLLEASGVPPQHWLPFVKCLVCLKYGCKSINHKSVLPH